MTVAAVAGPATTSGCAPAPALASTTRVAAAAHEALRRALAGRPRPATPLVATRGAVVLRVPGELPVSVLAADAVRLPGSVVLGAASTRLDLGSLGPGTPASVGGGLVRVGPYVATPTRWWSSRPAHRASPTALKIGLARFDALADAEPAGTPAGPRTHPSSVAVPPGLRERLDRGRDAFAEALLLALLDAAAGDASLARTAVPLPHAEHLRACLRAADALLGLGPGLTPAGDDVLTGVLVTVRRLRPSTARALDLVGGAVAARASVRTSPVSAGLLGWAAAGEAVPELHALVDALGRGGDPAPAFAALARVGHTSGRDLAGGARAGAGVVLALSTADPSAPSPSAHDLSAPSLSPMTASVWTGPVPVGPA